MWLLAFLMVDRRALFADAMLLLLLLLSRLNEVVLWLLLLFFAGVCCRSRSARHYNLALSRESPHFSTPPEQPMQLVFVASLV